MKTILVLGAGASMPYGFPSGGTLCDIVKVELRPTHAELRDMQVEPRPYEMFREELKTAGRGSVDAFLESRPDLLEYGKLAIALVLLPRERHNNLFDKWPNRRLQRVKPEKTGGGHWYELMLNMLTQGRKFDEVDLTRLGVITFNYDRSLEHYLFTALKHSYDKTDAETSDKLSALPIVHVHGSLGRLPWQPARDDASVVPYGHKSPTDILSAKNSIKVLHEADESSAEFERARELIVAADRVFFFGFGFHRSNLTRLGLKGIKPSGPVGGTARGLSYDTKTKTKAFQFFTNQVVGKPPRWQDKDIYDYLHDHITFDI